MRARDLAAHVAAQEDRALTLDEAPYPVACLPQAWASGSVFLLLQACLGIQVNGERQEVRVTRPMLPIDVESLAIRGLPVGDASIDLDFHRIDKQVVVVPSLHVDSGVRVLAHL